MSATTIIPETTPDFAAIARTLGLPYLHPRADGSWAVPSTTVPGDEYTVWLTCPADPTCSCGDADCEHVAIAQVSARKEDIARRGQQAIDDLFGPRAA